MVLPLDLVVAVAVVDAVGRLSGDQLHSLCAAWNASRRARIPQREHSGKSVIAASLLRPLPNLPNLPLPELTGVRKCPAGLRNTF
jgi:hypothetical protein